MSIAFVQGNNNTGQSGTTVPLAFTSNNTVGSLLILTVRGTLDATSITDSAGNSSWTQVDHLQNNEWCSLWFNPNCLAGANTVTAHFASSASSVYLAVGEYSGVATVSPLDTHGITSGNSATATAPSVAALAGALVLGYTENHPGVTYTVGGGYTLRQNNIGAAYEDQLNVTAGNFSPSFGMSASDLWVAGVATFKAAVTPGSGRSVVCIMQ